LAEVVCLGDGKFKHRFDGADKGDFNPGLQGLEGLMFYAEFRPELHGLLIEHVWNTVCKKGEAPDSMAVWEILKLKEKSK